MFTQTNLMMFCEVAEKTETVPKNIIRIECYCLRGCGVREIFQHLYATTVWRERHYGYNLLRDHK